MIRDQRSALIQLFVAEILIGSVGIFVEEGGRDAVTSVFFRCVFGSLFLIAWGLKTGQLQGVLTDRVLMRGAIFSGVLLVLNWVALFAGMARSSIGVATMVYHFFPFAMLAFAALFYGERTRPADIGWSAIAFAGVALSADPVRLWHEADASYLFGIGLTFLAALLAGAAMMMSRRISRERPLGVVLIQCLVGIAMLAPFANYASVAMPGAHWGWLIGLGVLHSGVVYVLFYRAYPRLSVGTIAVLAFVYPAVALLLDYLVYGHALGILQFAGVGLIVLGTLGVNLKWTLIRKQPASAYGASA
jgi:drug/metabolite transporter (DMT)-like permease